tara:strand:+ start:395 stop:547 length:153 start_codon:yes stop_codon:yes gene_type:complete
MKIDFNKEDRFYEKIKSEIPKKKDELINLKNMAEQFGSVKSLRASNDYKI